MDNEVQLKNMMPILRVGKYFADNGMSFGFNCLEVFKQWHLWRCGAPSSTSEEVVGSAILLAIATFCYCWVSFSFLIVEDRVVIYRVWEVLHNCTLLSSLLDPLLRWSSSQFHVHLSIIQVIDAFSCLFTIYMEGRGRESFFSVFSIHKPLCF